MSPNTHSTDTLTLIILLLKSTCWAFKPGPLKGAWSCIRKSYAWSPYIQRTLPFGACECCWSCPSNPDSANIALSCRLPSTGPNKFETSPLGVTTLWNFMAWMRLCPLYRIRWFCLERLSHTWVCKYSAIVITPKLPNVKHCKAIIGVTNCH